MECEGEGVGTSAVHRGIQFFEPVQDDMTINTSIVITINIVIIIIIRSHLDQVASTQATVIIIIVTVVITMSITIISIMSSVLRPSSS